MKLKNSFELGAELNDKRVRLIIYKDGDKYVCRKESFNKLEKFLNEKNAHTFKVQLQLYKESADINIIKKIQAKFK